MTEVEVPSQNGVELITDEDDNNKARPADIEQDMREMERRKRVEAIMGSRLFREELERIVDSQIREGGSSGILQQLSDIVGVPTSRVGNAFKSSNCVLPINDIRGVESMGYSKGEKILRCKLAATFRLLDLNGWTKGLGAQVTARLKVDQELFLVNPYGLLFHEVTASSLNKVDMQGNVVEHGTTNFGVNKNHFILHSVVHAARPDIRCAIYIGCKSVVAISTLKAGLLPLTRDSVILGEISTHQYSGCLSATEEREKLVRNLGPVSKVILLTNHGALCCGETIEEAYFAAHHIVEACETQLKLLPIGFENLVVIPEECRKSIFDAARRPPEDIAAAFEKKLAAAAAASEDASTADESQTDNSKETNHKMVQQPKWRVGGAEFEALMRMLDNAGFRTGYIYRHPLIKSELPKAKNDVELPPAVSSLGYLLEEEELYRQGIWKKGDWRKGGDRSRWLNSPNVYQKVEVLETGTPDPKKITKWVADGSPTHSTPVRIEGALQFVPPGTNPKEFKKVQQQIKDNRRADKISAGPQSHILEGVTWDEANRIKDATVSSAGDHVVLMGAASKGIIQRGFQHNATVYKAPYAKNPFDNVTDDELNEYKRTVERKKNIHGDYTDTDFSESEALSSLPTSGAQQKNSSKIAAASQSETEDALEHHVMRIETKQAPVPSQPEVVLSDDQESYFTNSTNKSSDTDNQERKLVFGSANGSNQLKFFNLMPFDTFALPYFRNFMQLNTHTQFFSEAMFETWPFQIDLNSSDQCLSEENGSECVTPRICFPVVQNDLHTFADNLIFSIPYSKLTKNLTNINKRTDLNLKPYRTHSHFGFNYSKRQVQPTHFHIPVTPSKYVPLKKSFSYNEFFSSVRYVNLCDVCFEKVLSLRPACSNTSSATTTRTGQSINHKLAEDVRELSSDNKCYIPDHSEALQNWTIDDYVYVNRTLEPVLEVDEEVACTKDLQLIENVSNLTEFKENSTCSDRIIRMNNSRKPASTDSQPCNTIAADETVKNESHLKEMSLMESIDCINVKGATSPEQPIYEECTPSDLDLDDLASPANHSSANLRKLMSREERNQRKLEFTKLWEDHLEYFSPRKFSDSESESDIEENINDVFYGKTRLNNLSGSASVLSNETFRVQTQLKTEQDLHAAASARLYSLYASDPLLCNSELNSMEQIILAKIEANHLKQQDPIFNDIEKTIRHKMTPYKLQKLVRQQQNVKNNTLMPPAPNVLSCNNASSDSSSPDGYDMAKKDKISSPNSQETSFSSLNKNEVNRKRKVNNIRIECQNRLPSSFSSSTVESPGDRNYISMSTPKKPKKSLKSSRTFECIEQERRRTKVRKNFIAENILNASITRRRCNAQRGVNSNNFGYSASTPVLSSNKIRKSNSQPLVYSFESKSVRGSPMFWVTLSPRNKSTSSCSILKSKSQISRKHCHMEKSFEAEKEQNNNEDFSIEKFRASMNSNLEREINCLGKQIEALKPRLDEYKETIGEYSGAITNFSKKIDVVMETQNEIQDERRKFREQVVLNQYVENVRCELETFSISETED